MNQPGPHLYCPNPACSAPLNTLGKNTCQTCGTALVYRYLWAVGPAAAQVAVGASVGGGRYYVTAPRLWLDTQPALPPDIPDTWPEEAIAPYLRLYPKRLHLPEVYGFCLDPKVSPQGEIFLLENIPLDRSNLLYPALSQAWVGAHPVRQVYWLWQLLELWTPLQTEGVAASLFAPDNLRVEGWRVRLCQLYRDAEVLPLSAPELTLADLASLWLGWVERAHPDLRQPLQQICQAMQQEGATVTTISTQLNQRLLQQAAQLPLHLNLVGLTDAGRDRSHNEDSCYPLGTSILPNDGLFPRVAIVCDGIGGHEGGEVASQLAVQSFKLQAQALLAEVLQQSELVSPHLLSEQLEASVRVVNNLIATQNNDQGREDRRRMGTTLIMALQVPQRLPTPTGTFENSHELYLVSVGDSRAYWITPRYCQQLTVDDDVATREVRMGRSLYREALQRPDAGALTQALGTRDSDYLRPTVQRFILEEDGILLLCSDGLSDHHLVEQYWPEITDPFFLGKRTLLEIAHAWIDLANQKNGHDNTSLALLHVRVSTPVPVVNLPSVEPPISRWSEASHALAEPPTASEPETAPPARSGKGLLILAVLALGLLIAGVGAVVWREMNSQAPRQEQSPPASP